MACEHTESSFLSDFFLTNIPPDCQSEARIRTSTLQVILMTNESLVRSRVCLGALGGLSIEASPLLPSITLLSNVEGLDKAAGDIKFTNPQPVSKPTPRLPHPLQELLI